MLIVFFINILRIYCTTLLSNLCYIIVISLCYHLWKKLIPIDCCMRYSPWNVFVYGNLAKNLLLLCIVIGKSMLRNKILDNSRNSGIRDKTIWNGAGQATSCVAPGKSGVSRSLCGIQGKGLELGRSMRRWKDEICPAVGPCCTGPLD